jgi:hypothetical protein
MPDMGDRYILDARCLDAFVVTIVNSDILEVAMLPFAALRKGSGTNGRPGSRVKTFPAYHAGRVDSRTLVPKEIKNIFLADFMDIANHVNM